MAHTRRLDEDTFGCAGPHSRGRHSRPRVKGGTKEGGGVEGQGERETRDIAKNGTTKLHAICDAANVFIHLLLAPSVFNWQLSLLCVFQRHDLQGGQDQDEGIQEKALAQCCEGHSEGDRWCAPEEEASPAHG